MIVTDTSEKGLESLIVKAMTGREFPDPDVDDAVHRPPLGYGGWLLGDARHYDRDCCIDVRQLSHFLFNTQPKTAALLNLAEDVPARRTFFVGWSGR